MILEFKNASGQMFKVPHERIMFVLKKPLEPLVILALDGGALIPIHMGGDFPNFNDLETKLEDFGFKTFISHPDNGTAVMNLDHMLFFTSPELGVYGLIFKGQAAVVVKATEKDILTYFEPRSSILSG